MYSLHSAGMILTFDTSALELLDKLSFLVKIVETKTSGSRTEFEDPNWTQIMTLPPLCLAIGIVSFLSAVGSVWHN